MKTSSRAMHMAHHLLKMRSKKCPFLDAKDRKNEFQCCLRRGWYFVRFNEWLLNGIITFSFFKKDGSIREAVGTKNLRIIPKDKWPKTNKALTGQTTNYQCITFFDLDKQEWRSFDITRFIGFVSVYQLVLFFRQTRHKMF